MKFLAPLFLIILSACVTTKTTGYLDPAYRDSSYTVNKVVVKATSDSMEESMLAETELVNKFSSLGVEAIKYTDIIPPTRNYETAEVMKLVKKTGADSMFIASTNGKSTIESYVPPTYHAGSSTSYISGFGNYATVNTYHQPSYTTGGYSISTPTMTTSSYLFDLKNGNTIWQAEGSAGGNAFSNYSELLISSGKDAISDLVEKGLIVSETPVQTSVQTSEVKSQ